MGFQRNSGWSRESNSTKTGMGSTRPPRLHNRFICSFPPWLGNGSFLMSQGWETHVKWKSSREMSHKNRSFESFLEMCLLFASNWFHLFPFPYSTPGQSRICLLIMWFCTLANVTKNCTLTRCASNPLVCHQTPPSQLKLAQTCQAQATVSILQHSNETRFNKETHTDMATRIRSCIK